MTQIAPPTPGQRAGRRPGSLRHHRPFLLFLGAAAVSNGGNWMQLMAVQTLLFRMTGSGAWLGLFTVATLVPAMLLTPAAGVLADRVQRRRILLVTQTVQMSSALALLALYVADRASPAAVLAVGASNGIATGFQTAAWQSFMPSLVPRSALRTAIRVNSAQYTVARLIGPVAGAAALAAGGVGAAIAANAASFAVVIAVLLVVRPRPDACASRADGGVTANLRAGLAYVWERPSLRLAVQLAFGVSMLGQSFQYLAAAIADGIYGRGGEANAGLLVCFGLGAMVSSLTMLTIGRRWRSSYQVVVALTILAVANVMMASSTVYAIGAAAYVLIGVSQVQSAVALNTVLQSTIADHYRGRVMSLYLLGILAGIPAGSQVLGIIGDIAGFRIATAANAAAIVVLLGWLTARGRWRLMDSDAGT